MPSESTGRGHRTIKVGEVVSRSGEKTIVVEVERRVQHPKYKRYVNRRKKFHAHDERNQCRIGDRVRIVQTRPMSRLKHWRLAEILYRKAGAVIPETAPLETAPDRAEAGSEKA